MTVGVAVTAASASLSSRPSSNWSASRVSRSDERPNAMRRSRATCIRSCSSSAPAATSMAFRRSTSSGSEAASGDTPTYTRTAVPAHPKAAESSHFYQASVGCDERIGWRQSTPSSSIDSCAGVNTATPSGVVGQVEPTAFQPLGVEDQTLAIPPQQLGTRINVSDGYKKGSSMTVEDRARFPDR